MIDSLEDITNETVVNDVTKPELGSDRSSKFAAAIIAAIMFGDMIYVYYTKKYCGGARSIFEGLHPVNETNYINLMVLEGLYTIGFSLYTLFS